MTLTKTVHDTGFDTAVLTATGEKRSESRHVGLPHGPWQRSWSES